MAKGTVVYPQCIAPHAQQVQCQPGSHLQAAGRASLKELVAVLELLGRPVSPRHAAQVRIQVDGAMQPVYVLQQ